VKTLKTEQQSRIKADCFKSFLQNELMERCRKNSGYSLRAFARSLKVEPSSLSQILNGKRPLSKKMKLRLGTALGLSVEEIHKLRSPGWQNSLEDVQKDLPQIDLDAFSVISDWYYYAILELTYLKDFKSDAKWVSRRLGITKSEASIAVERLFRIGLLKTDASGNWSDASMDGELTHLNPAHSSDAARKHQIQLLELSKQSVQRDDLNERNHTSVTFSFDPDDLPAAIEKIARFRRAFARQFQPKEKAKEVYQLQISFYPLTKRRPNEIPS
jgi:plasmid maintenance system antidote protein VapI